ncbi:MAG TPA: polysaccharide biosynthesis/export family protein [Syntrophales bacterium]|nr:polysaccharide biosynthesis/export family protein [Syntrophales bacterium]HOL60183.1 polysaccharide biosynthesis/export family protein [Syntrophales bacterium]HPO36315.1 polysaccharide biosynthesis/export family protein [Syntrophales bacterium]
MSHFPGERVVKIALIFLVLSFLCACMMEYSGIPVNEYDQTYGAKEREDPAKIKENREAVAQMSRVKENSVFTEKRGFPEYKVGPGDILTITFWSTAVGGAQTFEGFRQINYDLEVRPDGKISYMYGTDIPVSGLTTSEIHEILMSQLKKYFLEPRVEVKVKEYRSKYATLFGQINTLPTGSSGPGRYVLTNKTTVLDLISRAGGPITGRAQYSSPQVSYLYGSQLPVENADLTKVELLRKGKTYTINLLNAMFYGDETQNPIVEDGDVITVPPEPYFADRVYVLGQVAAVGILRLRDAPDLLAAIAMAGGFTTTAIRKDIKIIREFRERQGKPIIISANYDKIVYQGDLSQNIKLKSGDVIYVPRSTIGDINEFIINTTPLLNYLLIPGSYRDAYFSPNNLRY